MLTPKSAKSWYRLGAALIDMSEDVSAYRALFRALGYAPRDKAIKTALGEALILMSASYSPVPRDLDQDWNVVDLAVDVQDRRIRVLQGEGSLATLPCLPCSAEQEALGLPKTRLEQKKTLQEYVVELALTDNPQQVLDDAEAIVQMATILAEPECLVYVYQLMSHCCWKLRRFVKAVDYAK